VTLPRNGSTVHGKQFLDVGVSDQFDVRKVDYLLSGPGREGVNFATGSPTHYGWIGRWNTSTVPNGIYVIEAKVSDSGGRFVTTAPVEVRVAN
jgi:methenyltetrahydromethanopterin cyclohydrolase